MSTTTRIEVRRQNGRLTYILRGGDLSPRRLDLTDDRARIALVATVALLLTGDHVQIQVVVGAGVELEIVEVAGTVAYDMRGGSARWCVDVRVDDGGLLIWEGLPFVVADGADVTRTMSMTLEGSAIVVTRESYVFGRTGQLGGDLRTSMSVTCAGRPLLVEQLDLGQPARAENGILGAARCLDAVTILGRRIGTDRHGALELEGAGSIERRLTDSFHDSDLARSFDTATGVARQLPRVSPA